MKNNGKKIFDFKVQQKIGDRGERDFLKYYATLGPKKSVDDRAIDFILADGKYIELKSDSYSMDETENFFMELYSDLKTSKIGGPLRAKQDNIDYFVYYFPKDKTFFWFATVPLCDRFEQLILTNKYKQKIIKNKGWNACGFAMPRFEFADLEIKRDCFLDKVKFIS